MLGDLPMTSTKSSLILIARYLPLTGLVFLSHSFLPAQWSTDPTQNNAICTASGGQNNPQVVHDGAGGAIMAWDDYRSGLDQTDVYAQHINSAGFTVWTTNGVSLSTATLAQQHQTITSDGFGGAIIAWEDYRTGLSDVYAQRIDSTGVPQWTTDGAPICTASGGQWYPQITSDGSGGAIVTWEDYRNGMADIYAQHINSSGVVQWSVDGAAICTASDVQYDPQIVSDGAGGVIITWYDKRSVGSFDIFAQRINAGAVQWSVNGAAICTAEDYQVDPKIVSDGSGGAIIVWTDYRNISTSHFDIYAQRISAAGVVGWTANGVAVTRASNEQGDPQLINDGSGGAVVTWHDYRGGVNFDIYAQHISTDGTLQWTTDGVGICTITSDQSSPVIVSDGSGGAIVTWEDYRHNFPFRDIYAQRISSAGGVQWTTNGVAVSTATNSQETPQIIGDGSGGAIIAWVDHRGGMVDIYAQRVNRNGGLTAAKETAGEIPQDFLLLQNYPNPFNQTTVLTYILPEDVHVSLRIFDLIGREVVTLVNKDQKTGRYDARLDASRLSSGVYLYTIQAGDFTDVKRMVLLR